MEWPATTCGRVYGGAARERKQAGPQGGDEHAGFRHHLVGRHPAQAPKREQLREDAEAYV